MILKISFILVLLSSAFIFDLQAKELLKRRLEIQKLKERAEVAYWQTRDIETIGASHAANH